LRIIKTAYLQIFLLVQLVYSDLSSGARGWLLAATTADDCYPSCGARGLVVGGDCWCDLRLRRLFFPTLLILT